MNEEKKPRVYIAGKISGMDKAEAIELFEVAQLVIEVQGHEAVNPFEVSEESPRKEWHDYMGECHRALLMCQAVLMLPNWHNSRGARIEYAVAREMGIPVYFGTREYNEACKAGLLASSIIEK